VSAIFSFITDNATTAVSALNNQSWWMRLLPKYGYLAILVAAFWEGEVVLIAAGALCGSGYLDWRLTILAAAIGGSAGDQVYFYAAHDRAARAIKKSKRLSKWYPKISKFVLRHSTVAVLFSRFAAGLRITIPLVCATVGMPAKKYSILSLVSGFAWASFWVAVSYQAGAHLK
jgi:membrane protein DedA with SNARE-associated domain